MLWSVSSANKCDTTETVSNNSTHETTTTTRRTGTSSTVVRMMDKCDTE